MRQNESGEVDAIVIGGGPAGLFLASRLAERIGASSEGRIVVLEKMAKPGRKLLVSGTGRCNITHQGPITDFLSHYGGAGRFLKKALYAFSNEDLASWLVERGIELEAEEGGKLFPASRKASDILRALLEECGRHGVSLLTSTKVVALRRREGGRDGGRDAAFLVDGLRADGTLLTLGSRLLAIAAGGSSYPGTGSSGEGYALAASLGHSIVPPRPALTPLVLRDPALCVLAGLSFEDLAFAIRRGGKRIGGSRGDVLITHEGLSGPGILDASRGLEPGDLLELDFAGLGLEGFRAALASRVAAAPRSLVRTVLADAGLPKRLAELICALVGRSEDTLSGDTRCAELKREARDAMARMAAAFPAEIGALGGFEKAMVTAGGVSLGEVDSGTMASRVVEGLYFAGEVLDYDGDTGGYNLQAAFSSADAAARAMME
jgi:predicted Rossmann fold flavoprotein